MGNSPLKYVSIMHRGIITMKYEDKFNEIFYSMDILTDSDLQEMTKQQIDVITHYTFFIARRVWNEAIAFMESKKGEL